MRDTHDPSLISYLEAENRYTEAWFNGAAETISAIEAEIKSRIQETDVSAPVAHGPWYYVGRTEQGLPYPIMCRAADAESAVDPERTTTLLDLNVEAAGTTYFDLGAFEPDPTHQFIAWSADTSGDEHYTLRIRSTDTGTELDDQIPDTAAAGVAWSHDSTIIVYVVADDTERPYQVKSHRIGTNPDTDRIIWTEHDERFYVGIGTTRSGKWIIIHSGSRTSSEVHLIDVANVTAEPRCVRPRIDDVEYSVDDWGDHLVICTNEDAEDFRIMLADHDAPSSWREFEPHVPGRRIASVEAFATTLAVHEWLDAQPRIRLIDRAGSSRVVAIDTEPHDIEFGPNEEYHADSVRLVLQSFTTPSTVLDVAIDTLDAQVVRRTPAPGVNLDDYVAERRWALAPDGQRVPYDIVRHRSTVLDGTAPAVVYAYGAYEVSVPPWYSAARLSLVDRGVLWVLAHPRGGGELGRRWYLEGRLLSKRNTFTDVIAVADDLADGIADGSRLAVRGGSAGGLMVGACITLRPDRFRSALAEVPFVDVVATMSDPTLPLTVTEWEEWGDPRAEPYASYISSYSPYDNSDGLHRGALLVTAGLNDPRVSVHEPAKWVAKLRASSVGDAPLLLRTEMGAGHAGPSDRYAAWREEATNLAFLLATL